MTMNVERLLVVSPNWLGDAVMALPAIGDLRRHFPHSRLLVAARKSVAGLFSMTPLADEVVVLEWPGRLWARAQRHADITKLRSLRADVSVVLPNSFASAWMVKRAGIRERWGYAADLRDRLLSRAVPRPAIRVHQSEYYRRLMKGLNIENGSVSPELVVSTHSLSEARTLLASNGWDGSRSLVVMAPGAAYGGAKRWPSDHFADVALQMIRHQQVSCVLIGSSADAATTSQVRALVPDDARAQVIDLAGSTSLDTLAGVLRLASACVSNDSGAMHLAGAVGVPLAALFGPTRERETAPLSGVGGRTDVLINHVWCRPCMLRECPLDHRCMTGLSPDRVIRAVTNLMTNPEPRIPNSGPRAPDPGSRPNPESRVMSRPAVFLDRDGTIVEECGYLAHLESLTLFPWTIDALRLIKRAGFATVVITNQAAVGRGIIEEDFVHKVHREIDRRLEGAGARIDRYYYCPHFAESKIERYRQECLCRKPAPGMIQQACRDMDLDPARSIMVGDRWLDVACGRAAGTRAVLVRSGPHQAEAPGDIRADAILNNLMEAVGWILRSSSRS